MDTSHAPHAMNMLYTAPINGLGTSMEPCFDIVFRGKLLTEDRAQVVTNLATLFDSDPARVEAMLQSPKTVLRRALPHEVAVQYRDALREAGIMVATISGKDQTEDDSEQPWRIAAIEPAAPAPSTLSLSELGTPLGEKRAFAAPKLKLGGLRIATDKQALAATPKPVSANIAVPDFSVEAREDKDKARSDFATIVTKELRT